MIELGAMKRDSIVKLCEDSRISLVRAAAEGKGRAFVPTLESPSCCLVLTGGFSYLVGMPPRGAASLDLYHVLAKECGDASILAEDVRWDEWIETKFSGRFRTVSRYLLRAPEEGFDFKALELRTEVPAEYEIREVTAPLFKRLGELRFSENLTASFADADVFAAYGIGFCSASRRRPEFRIGMRTAFFRRASASASVITRSASTRSIKSRSNKQLYARDKASYNKAIANST